MSKSIISATNISKSYEQFVVLKNVSFSIKQGEKIALVGPNGIGKTTLFKILIGEIKADEGVVTKSKATTIGYIPQVFNDSFSLTVKEFLAGSNKNFQIGETLNIFSRLHLNETIVDRNIGELSGGEKTKVALARILLDESDVLLLDEPTNNVDVEALELLEKFVKESVKTFLIISHDRAFLDASISKVFEIDEFDRNLHIYEGNYSSYIEERKARIERQWATYDDAIKKEEHTKEIIKEKLTRADAMDKIPPRDNDKMLRNFKIEHGKKAYQRGAMLLKQKLENADEIERPKNVLPSNLSFEVDERSGDNVFELRNVTKKLPEHVLGPLDLSIQYADRLLITGPNGVGKTTLLNILLEVTSSDSGEILKGKKVHIGVLPQEENFISEETVKQTFLRFIEIEEGNARKILNRFRLEVKDVDKKIKELSSGEKSRLILAILMAQKVNCLILDEPSNHLDLEIAEALEKALQEFKGTLVVVSHDRYFIDRMHFTKRINLTK